MNISCFLLHAEAFHYFVQKVATTDVTLKQAVYHQTDMPNVYIYYSDRAANILMLQASRQRV